MSKPARKTAKYWKKVTRPKPEPIPADTVLSSVLEAVSWGRGKVGGQKLAEALGEVATEFQAANPRERPAPIRAKLVKGKTKRLAASWR